MEAEKEFLTIAEAARLLSESDATIMRLIKEVIQSSDLTLDDIMKKEERERGTVYVISKEFLITELGKAKQAAQPKESFEERNKEEVAVESEIRVETQLLQAKDEMIGTLQKVMDTKDKHIEDLSHKIDQLIERYHETNILLKGLQDKIFLIEQGPSKPSKKTEDNSKRK